MKPPPSKLSYAEAISQAHKIWGETDWRWELGVSKRTLARWRSQGFIPDYINKTLNELMSTQLD